MYLAHITLVTPTLHSQLVLRERLQGETWLQPQRPLRHTYLISTTADGLHNQTLAQQASVSWKNELQPWRLPVPWNSLMVRAMSHRQTQVVASNIKVVQPELWRFPGMMEHWAEPFESTSGNFRVPKIQRPTAFSALLPAASPLTQPTRRTQPGHPEADAGFIQQGQRSVELSYVLPSASTVAKPEQRQEASSRFAPPIGFPSVPTPSQVPGIDVNRLTEQVYQALERKIRLEKQRRGYR